MTRLSEQPGIGPERLLKNVSKGLARIEPRMAGAVVSGASTTRFTRECLSESASGRSTGGGTHGIRGAVSSDPGHVWSGHMIENAIAIGIAATSILTGVAAIIVALAWYRWAGRCDPKNPNFRPPLINRKP